MQTEKRSQLTQHIDTAKHKANVLKYNRTPQLQQALLTNRPGVTRQDFCAELCDAFLAADIPLKKLQNPTLRTFLSKNIKHQIPDESTIRKNYLKPAYNKVCKLQGCVDFRFPFLFTKWYDMY